MHSMGSLGVFWDYSGVSDADFRRLSPLGAWLCVAGSFNWSDMDKGTRAWQSLNPEANP